MTTKPEIQSPRFSFEVYQKTEGEKRKLKELKKNYKLSQNSRRFFEEKNAIIKQIVSSKAPEWGNVIFKFSN
jgi:hypothetical protein